MRQLEVDAYLLVENNDIDDIFLSCWSFLISSKISSSKESMLLLSFFDSEFSNGGSVRSDSNRLLPALLLFFPP
jgi:hypothetical protein